MVEVVGVLAGQHDGAGAQSVTEAVQLNGRMAMFGDGIYYVPASRQIWFYSFAENSRGTCSI